MLCFAFLVQAYFGRVRPQKPAKLSISKIAHRTAQTVRGFCNLIQLYRTLLSKKTNACRRDQLHVVANKACRREQLRCRCKFWEEGAGPGGVWGTAAAAAAAAAAAVHGGRGSVVAATFAGGEGF